MAGAPKRRALVKAITEAGGEDALIERIADGETIASIAEELDFSRPMLSSFLNRSANTKERIARARETASHALVEEALRIADSATHENDRAKRLQVSTRQWLASKYNRRDFGDETEVRQPIDIGQIYLQVLQLTNALPQPHSGTVAAADGSGMKLLPTGLGTEAECGPNSDRTDTTRTDEFKRGRG